MDTTFNPTFEDDMKTVLAEVPAPVRAFIAAGRIQLTAKALAAKNHLTEYQGVVIGRELMLLVLGINSPEEFTQTLVSDASLGQVTVDNIAQDVNDQVFIPLQEEMKRVPVAVPQPPRPVVPQQVRVAVAVTAPRPVNVPVPSYAPVLPRGSYAPRPSVASQPVGVVGPPLQSPSYFPLENKIAPRPINPGLTRPGERSDLRNALAAAMTTAPRLINGEKLLEDHEEPHIEFPTSPKATQGTVGNTPLHTSVVRQLANGVVPPNLPGALPPRIVPPVVPISTKPYSDDPYREPIDEEGSR